jgi:hypothetical protein
MQRKHRGSLQDRDEHTSAFCKWDDRSEPQTTQVWGVAKDKVQRPYSFQIKVFLLFEHGIHVVERANIHKGMLGIGVVRETVSINREEYP